jgi:hypothetical protein
MRSFLKIVSAAGLAMAFAASAQATQFSAFISYGLSTLPPLQAFGSGSGASTVGPNLVTLPATPFAATGPIHITLNPTAAAPLSALDIRLTAPVNCNFTGTPIGGPCALGGTANALVGYAPFLVVPNSPLGQNTRLGFGPYGSYIDAQAWIAATATATVAGSPILSDNGAPFTTVGYDNRTAAGGGLVKLVAPGGLMSTLGGNLPIFVTMFLDFVPEPGTPLLLASGIAGAVILGRRRMRS